MANPSAAKQRRLAKRSGTPVPIASDSNSDDEVSSKPVHIPRSLTINVMPGVPQARLLIASLGNPAPYLDTRHSAGHALLKSLAYALSCPNLSRDRAFAGGLTATPPHRPNWLLWQSPSLMNVSGPPLRDALLSFMRRSTPGNESRVGLILLHDELESPLGTIQERSKKTGHQGHNGLKSVGAALRNSHLHDALDMIKIGIGIGRPDSRESKDVSDYVLNRLTWEERQKIEDGTDRALKLIEAFAAKLSQPRPPLKLSKD